MLPGRAVASELLNTQTVGLSAQATGMTQGELERGVPGKAKTYD